MRTTSMIVFLLASSAGWACVDQPEVAQASGSTWLPPNGPERDVAIERQFRGFDMAMVETGYRFTELYWAGVDQNWPYATYQADKIRTAIENGLERRPLRAPSAQSFLNEALPAIVQAIEAGDSARFAERIQLLRGACNSCHAAELMEFVNVMVPTHRAAPVGS